MTDLSGRGFAELGLIVAAALVLPFAMAAVERHLEIFLLALGAGAVTISGVWSQALVVEALREPVRITAAVFLAGLAFHYGRDALDRFFAGARRRLPLRVLYVLVVVGLGLLSSIITAIIAALVLVECVNALKLNRSEEVRLTVVACFAIGLGAVLTPVGEPLSTIVTSKLHGDFWLLARQFGWFIVPGVAVLGLWAARIPTRHGHDPLAAADPKERSAEVWTRTVRVYAFVAALVLLGRGLMPLVDRFIARLPAPLLFWVNMVSAILDNATLAAAEISPAMDARRVTAVMLGLLISGGMLIPGNIPNIVSAGHLKIGSREWANVGIPLGLVLMTTYFVVWMVVG